MNIDQMDLARVMAERSFVSVCCACHAILGVKKSVHHGMSHDICPACMVRLYPELARRATA